MIVFEKAQTKADWARLGKQFPGMTLTLFTDDIDATVAQLTERGVKLLEPVRRAPWGTQTAIADLYGNVFDISATERRARSPPIVGEGRFPSARCTRPALTGNRRTASDGAQREEISPPPVSRRAGVRLTWLGRAVR